VNNSLSIEQVGINAIEFDCRNLTGFISGQRLLCGGGGDRFCGFSLAISERGWHESGISKGIRHRLLGKSELGLAHGGKQTLVAGVLPTWRLFEGTLCWSGLVDVAVRWSLGVGLWSRLRPAGLVAFLCDGRLYGATAGGHVGATVMMVIAGSWFMLAGGLWLRRPYEGESSLLP
jgi:hypothetical protein